MYKIYIEIMIDDDLSREELKMSTAVLDKVIDNPNTSNVVYELKVSKSKFNDFISKLEKPGLTKEYLEECIRTANLYKKPTKQL